MGLKPMGWLVLATGCVPSLYTEAGQQDWVWEAPENTWPQSDPPEGLVGTGYGEGMVVPDFRLTDQHGDEVSLWQFHGSVVLLDVSTMWCAPCQELAKHTEETWSDYIDQDFMYITILQEDVEGEPTTVEDLNEWSSFYGITSPVIGDPDKEGTGGAVELNQYPAVLVIDRDLVVAERVNPPNDEEVRAAIEDVL